MFPETTILLLSGEADANLLWSDNHAPDPESRTRLQMSLRAVERDLAPSQIAPLVHRAHDTVVRVLRRYQTGGLAAVPPKTGPGPKPNVTAPWQEELLRVMDDDPQAHGVNSATWTTSLLAEDLAATTGITVHPETVRRWLHRHDYVCKRPTWTVEHTAPDRDDWLGKGCGERFS